MQQANTFGRRYAIFCARQTALEETTEISRPSLTCLSPKTVTLMEPRPHACEIRALIRAENRPWNMDMVCCYSGSLWQLHTIKLYMKNTAQQNAARQLSHTGNIDITRTQDVESSCLSTYCYNMLYTSFTADNTVSLLPVCEWYSGHSLIQWHLNLDLWIQFGFHRSSEWVSTGFEN